MSVMGMASSAVKRIKNLPRKMFGSRNDRLLKGYRRSVSPIGVLERDIRGDFDKRFAERVAAEKIEALPEDEQAAARQGIRVELSGDLRTRATDLKARAELLIATVDQWWQALDASEQVQEYFKAEYRKRHTKAIEAMDAEGLSAEAFAVLREASRRAQDHRHFDCQLIGGRVLYEGRIAEMRTGEGKTIVCHLAAFINVLCGLKIHIITVNDYLVERDAEFAQPIFELLGVSVGFIQGQVDPGGREGIRQRAYACDITYGTNSEFGFDFLRDNMKTRLQDQVQGRLDFVIVDEVDSILIDEARTPLIISGPTTDDTTRYARANKVAEELVRRQVPWDRRVRDSVAKYDDDERGIPKLGDSMRILGYRKPRTKSGGKRGDKAEALEKRATTTAVAEDEAATVSALGPDFLTDDQVEAIQAYENDVLGIAPAEQYRRLFIVQLERKQVGITHDGVTVAQEQLDIGSLYSGANMEWPHLIENGLRAHKVYERDRDYVVQDGEVIIVDQFTGRLMVGRQWSDGLHQAIEAKENVRVKEETQTLATITIQNFVKLYRVKAGMTGTAQTEATEFDKIYRLEVVEIPTNRPVNRVNHDDKMYRNVEQKYSAIVEEIHDIHLRGRPADPFLLGDALTALLKILGPLGEDVSKIEQAIERFNNAELGDQACINFMAETYDEAMGDMIRGRPVLVGTTSVENSEKLSRLLTSRYDIEHEVLNAKNHSREADIIAKAGFASVPTGGRDKTPRGHVTIATNMAGRGTDIKLGPGVVYEKCKVPAPAADQTTDGMPLSVLYPPGVTKCCIHCEEYDPATNCAHCYKPKLDPRFPALGRTVCTLSPPCGLHIIGTERHEARRIDNQLRGRAGRQGDPGSSRFSLSLEDDLLKMFMPDWMLKMMEKLGFAEGASMEDKRLNKGIERAQRKVEERNFSIRKHLLDWDEPMDYQRKEFYTARQRILEDRGLPELIIGTITETIRSTLGEFLGGRYDRKCIAEWCHTKLDMNIAEDAIDTEDIETAERSVRAAAIDEAHDSVRTSIGEYIDPSEPPAQWDVGGLLQWAQRLFKLNLTQNQLRKMEPGEIEDIFCDAASAHFAAVDLSPIAVFLDPHYPLRTLSEWARSKFNIELPMDDLLETPSDEIESMLHECVLNAYRLREVEYPVDWCLDRAVGQEGIDNAAATGLVVDWANSKYNVGWSPESVQGKSVGELRETLIGLQREYFDTKIAEEIDRNTNGKSPEDAVEWARQRFGRSWNQPRFERFDGPLRDALLDQGREMLRWELTRLEQYVLLRIYDQAWKDHLHEMDHLMDSIKQRPLGGDQGHPQSQFAIEGRELFAQMESRIAGRVTDIIFKVQASSDSDGQSDARQAMVFRHADATGTGFSSTDEQAAMKAQNVEQKVETIRRDAPKVGRNDPCPCGSGKKYKQCHGRGNA